MTIECRRFLAPLVLLALAIAGLAQAAAAAPPLLPSPYDILRSQDLEPPVLDAVPICVPEGLDPATTPILEQAEAGDWRMARKSLRSWMAGFERPGVVLVVFDTVLWSRAEEERADRLEVEERLRALLRREDVRERAVCPRLELARILLFMDRISEASAHLTRAETWLDEQSAESERAKALRDAVAFYRAEILYRRGQAFDAHLAYRRLAQSAPPRLALAARLRLTDLSFDAGRAEGVSTEYETLLPRASAFGASTDAWALRAAEAALDVGETDRATRWLERFLETGATRDVRDAVEIRLADLDVAQNDPLAARKRLSSISGRRRNDPIGALAAVRAIDLDVAAGSAEQRVEILMKALRDQRRGVRRYALGVLMKQLGERGDYDGALVVATRLAYEGVDPTVTPNFTAHLDRLLDGIVAGDRDCRMLVRALGGRYGILIERASSPEPFAQVGECFESMELPWLASTLYRKIARRFGTPGGERVAMPLARTSLATSDFTLARRMAEAALETGQPDAIAWRAIRAEANFLDERPEKAAEDLRAVLDKPSVGRERGKLVRLLAMTLRDRRDLGDMTLIADRVPSWLEESGHAPGSRAAMVEAALLTAHAYRQAGWSARAHKLYRTVDKHAPPGALRASARFWLGLADQPTSNDEPAWGADPPERLGSPWGRVAVLERNLRELESAYGERRR